jgi:hypothetical protein
LPIQITAGTNSRIEGNYGYVSKLELATLLQVVSSAGRIHLNRFINVGIIAFVSATFLAFVVFWYAMMQ